MQLFTYLSYTVIHCSIEKTARAGWFIYSSFNTKMKISLQNAYTLSFISNIVTVLPSLEEGNWVWLVNRAMAIQFTAIFVWWYHKYSVGSIWDKALRKTCKSVKRVSHIREGSFWASLWSLEKWQVGLVITKHWTLHQALAVAVHACM